MRIPVLMLFITLLTACAGTTQQGKSRDDVTAQWGMPDKISTAPNGNTLYFYTTKTQPTTMIPNTSNYSTIVVPGGAAISMAPPAKPDTSYFNNLKCDTVIEMNKQQVVVSVTRKGSGCQ
jgi:hypothetical protein